MSHKLKQISFVRKNKMSERVEVKKQAIVAWVITESPATLSGVPVQLLGNKSS